MLAVVPSDLLDFLASAADDPELRRTRDALRVVFPLYREEVHVLARPGIATFADLAGRRVAVGDPDSGTLVTATLLLATAGVRPKEELRLGRGEALEAVRGGRADAMVEVEARPAAPLRDRVAVEDALHLVPVDLPALRGLYPAAAIPAGTYYPWQSAEVPTVAPRAVLVTLDWAGMEGPGGDLPAGRQGGAGGRRQPRAAAPRRGPGVARGRPRRPAARLGAVVLRRGGARGRRRATRSRGRWVHAPGARRCPSPRRGRRRGRVRPARRRRGAARRRATRSCAGCARSARSSSRGRKDGRSRPEGRPRAALLQPGVGLRHVPEDEVVGVDPTFLTPAAK